MLKNWRFISAILTALLLASALQAFAESEVLINRHLAERLSIGPGDEIELSTSGRMKEPRRFRVQAIYEEKPDPSQVPLKRSMIKMHISDLEELTGRTDQLDYISIRLREGADGARLASRLNSEAIGFTAYSAQELAVRSSATFQVVNRFHEAIAFITMLAGAIFIFALVVMRVEDQRKNVAILTVTGISRSTILKTFFLESVFFAFIASLAGAVLGYFIASIVNLYYQNFYNTNLIFAHVSGSILVRAIIISFVLGIVAGAFSWFRLKHLVVLQELGR